MNRRSTGLIEGERSVIAALNTLGADSPTFCFRCSYGLIGRKGGALGDAIAEGGAEGTHDGQDIEQTVCLADISSTYTSTTTITPTSTTTTTATTTTKTNTATTDTLTTSTVTTSTTATLNAIDLELKHANITTGQIVEGLRVAHNKSATEMLSKGYMPTDLLEGRYALPDVMNATCPKGEFAELCKAGKAAITPKQPKKGTAGIVILFLFIVGAIAGAAYKRRMLLRERAQQERFQVAIAGDTTLPMAENLMHTLRRRPNGDGDGSGSGSGSGVEEPQPYAQPLPAQQTVYVAADSARSVSIRQQSNSTGMSAVYAIPIDPSDHGPYVDDGFYGKGIATGAYIDDGFYATSGAGVTAGTIYAVPVADTEA